MQKILRFLLGSAAMVAAGSGAATAADVAAGGDSSRASMIVNVPEDALVYLQDQQMRSEGPVRHYVSPALERGAGYTYTMRVEVERNGRVLSESIRVPVRAGQRVHLNATLAENQAGDLALSVTPPAGTGTYRSFSFEPGTGAAPGVQPPAFQPPAFQPPSYYQAPSYAYPQSTGRSQPAGSRIEQRLRPGSWRR